MLRMQSHAHKISIFIAVFCALLVGCGTTSSVQKTSTSLPIHSATATSMSSSLDGATISPSPMPALPWNQAISAPGGSWVFARSNGNIGYSCFTNGDNTTSIWATQDRGAHASSITSLPAVPGAVLCAVSIDANNASMVVIRISGSFPVSSFRAAGNRELSETIPHSAPGVSEISDFLTLDAFQHWRLIPNNVTLDLFARDSNRLFAVIGVNPHYSGEPLVRDEQFVVSNDGLQTWQQHTMPVQHGATGGKVELLADAFSGELLYVFYDPNNSNLQLARSADGGSTWVGATTPEAMQQFVVAVPDAQHVLSMCFSDEMTVWCSDNGGRTWQQKPFTDQIDFSGTTINSATLQGITSSGDIVATRSNVVLRLQPQENRWQALGSLSGSLQGVFGPASANILWEDTGTSTWSSITYP